MLYSIEEIGQIIGGKFLQKTSAETKIEHLLFDSRQVSAPATSLFFALTGQRNNGHKYLSDLHRAGLRNFVVSENVDAENFPNSNILKVENTLAALQILAAAHRQKFKIPVIGITGSNGKTIVKTWLTQLLQPDFEVVSSPKSYNSQIGVPLSVWQMQPRHDLAIFEAGISRPGEMENLEKIIRPDIGIFTNIGAAHREGFETQQQKIEEKMLLFRHAKTLVFCADHEKIARAISISNFSKKTISWSATGQPADLQIIENQKLANGFIKIKYKIFHPEKFQNLEKPGFDFGKIFSFSLPFSDAASIENACHCLVVLLYFGTSPGKIRSRFLHLEPVEMRLELKAAINRCTLINDAYSNDLSSLAIALTFAAAQARDRKLTLILSDIFQSGLSPEILYQKVAEVILEKKVARCIGIGVDIQQVVKYLPKDFETKFYATTDDFLKNFNEIHFADELILLKGSRVFAFERIARRLEKKAHKTVLEVNLSALVHNLNVFGKLLRPGVKILAMVKASGYGSGAAEVAKLLEFHKIDYLGVAYADEGIELRQAGVNLPILVLNPPASGGTSLDAILRFRLEPEVYSLPGLADLIDFLGKERRIGIHLKFDTGMHRLGFEPRDLPELIEILEKNPHVEVKSVLSHLAASDAPGHDDFTKKQAAQFLEMSEKLTEAIGYQPLRHIVNTSGIARFPEFHFDMVRVGIGLYGVQVAGLSEKLMVVNTLKATISQIKNIAPGDTVGYNRNGKIVRPTRIATVSIGYADGLLRLAGNGHFSMQVHGKFAPTVGNICMDMTMLDVSEIPQAAAGDEVIVFGENPPVESLAKALQTIPYEVFTNISERVKRVYFQE